MEEEEFTDKKWRRGVLVGEKGGPSTPNITWRLRFPEVDADGGDQEAGNFSTIDESRLSTVSARKLGANLWEVHPHFSVARMKKGGSCSGRHRVNASLDGFHGRKSDQIASTNSLDVKDSVSVSGRCGGLKPSAELLQVLNRVWRLEEQNISNESLVKTLKVELGRSQVYIKKLTREKEKNRVEIDDLAEKFSRLKHGRRRKEKGDVREENDAEEEWEMKNLHHRLLREMSEIKSHVYDGFKQVEKQKKLRLLLEYLCDELAMGIKTYERKMRSMKQVAGTDQNCECPDRLVVHASETWLDGRARMGIDLPGSDGNIDSLDKLLSDIEACFRSRRLICSDKKEKLHNNAPYLCRHSLESFHLKESASAPRYADEDDSTTGMVAMTTRQRRKEEVEGRMHDFQKLDTSDDAFWGGRRTAEHCRRDGSKVSGRHTNKESAVNRALCRDRTDAGQSLGSEMSGCCTKLLNGVKVDTLEAKLMEARFEGKNKFPTTVIKGAT